MKYLSIFVALFLLLSFVACEETSSFEYEKSEPESRVASEEIIGYEDGFGFSESYEDVKTSFSVSSDDSNSDESDDDESYDFDFGNSEDENESSQGDDENSNDVSVPDVSKPDVSQPETSENEQENEDCEHKNQKIINAKTASCSQIGYSGDKVCSDCGVTVKKGSNIPKTDHPSFITINQKEATLKNAGYSGDKACSVCKTVVTEGKTVPKLEYFEVITPSVLKRIEDGFIGLVNAERASKGLHALTINLHLDDSAVIRAHEIKASFSHTRPNGESCFSLIDETIYSWTSLGENIGYTSHVSNETFYPSEEYFTPTDEDITKVYTKMFQAFKNSSGHYANIISPDFKHMGVGVTYAESDYEGIPYFYFAHFFGSD